MKIDSVSLNDTHHPYVIAEMSGNHSGRYEMAERLLIECAASGASAFKLQTYSPSSLTIDSRRPEYLIDTGPWKGRSLYDVYSQGQTPSEWIPDLFQVAKENKISIFSTPFSEHDVDVLEANGVSAYKIASFEINYVQLLKYIAKTGKPVIFSTGLATLDDIRLAYETLKENGASKVAILKCTTTYPAKLDNLNLLTIQHLRNTFEVPVGFSDHTVGTFAAIVAISLGATILEKHVKLDDDISSVDSSFSLPVSELRNYIRCAKDAALARGSVQDGPTEDEIPYLRYRRSIVAKTLIDSGEAISLVNTAVVRPNIGLPPSELDRIIGMKAVNPIAEGEGITLDKITRK